VIGLVLVGHSAAVVHGVAAMVAQVAPGVPVAAAGGLRGGRLGTDALDVARAVREALAAAGDDDVVALLDLGSAWMALELALDELEPWQRARIHPSDAPLVEGAVVAAVAAAGGAGAAEVVAAAERALDRPKVERD
jgi:dihydroxyacetone kinase phosphotransfer subunit